MNQILGVKFSDHGPVCYFASGIHELRTGQSVLVETDQGLALGRVATAALPDGGEQPLAHVRREPVLVASAGPESIEPEIPEASAPAPFEASLGANDWDAVLPVEPAALAEPIAEPAAELSGEPAAESATESANGHTPLFASDQAAAQPVPHSLHGLQVISRIATESDLETHAENLRLARRAFTFCRGCINEQNLDMKLVDVEVLHDRSKLIFFFTAPNRIDFRELIKSLVREFHTRIELRQIGVRHETQMIGALGNCGQVVCCRRFLRKFAPVTIKMAKEQNLFLNPAKISGICGRLLCCLSYEQKGYEEFHKQCPKIGKRIQTPIGSVKVLRANFFKKSISVWVEDVGEREFTLDEWKEMLNRPPGEAPPAAPAPESQPRQGSRSTGRVSTGRPARPERGARPERSDRPDRPERPERADRPDKAERPERAARPERPERTERPDRVDRDKPEAAVVREAAAAAPGEARPAAPEGPAGEGRERQRPRRKRRKSKGPKPTQ